MLVVSEIVPEGPAAQAQLQPGDVVVQVGGELCNSFVGLESRLDDAVGSTIDLCVCRGGELIRTKLQVDDLHALTPHRYVEVGGAVLNELSYQQARNYGMPVRGVYVAHPGYMLRQARINKGSILCAVNGVPTPSLASFVHALDSVAHGERMVVRYFDLGARAHTHLIAVRMDRKWFPMSDCARASDGDGSWQPEQPGESSGRSGRTEGGAHVDVRGGAGADVGAGGGVGVTAKAAGGESAEEGAGADQMGAAGRPSSSSKELVTPQATAASEATSDAVSGSDGVGRNAFALADAGAPVAPLMPLSPQADGTEAAPPKDTAAAGGGQPVDATRFAAESLVTVDFARPFNIDGETGLRYRGAGLLLDAEKGLVVVDRNTVTSTLGDVSVTLGGQLSVPARVEYVHPTHNFALVRYDASALPKSLKLASAKLSYALPSIGSKLTLVGLKSGLNDDFDDSRPVDTVSRKTAVASFGWMKLPLPNPPRYQISNVEMIGLEVSPPLDGGVLIDETGGVSALWVSCAFQSAPNQSAQVFRGLPINLVKKAVDELTQSEQPESWRALGATLEPLSLATAQQLGLSAESRAAHAATKPKVGVPSVLLVTHVHSLSPAVGKLHGGDLLCSIDGERVASLYDAEMAVQGRDAVALEVVRDGKPLTIECATQQCSGLGTQQVVGWAGLLLQPTPDAVAAQRAVPVRGAYASYRFFGSPASRYDLSPTSHIIEVDAQPTPDLRSFLKATKHKADGEVVRVKHVDLEGRVRMSTLKLDLRYWPTYVLQRGADGEWTRSAP